MSIVDSLFSIVNNNGRAPRGEPCGLEMASAARRRWQNKANGKSAAISVDQTLGPHGDVAVPTARLIASWRSQRSALSAIRS